MSDSRKVMGEKWELQELVAVKGREGCQDVRCTRLDGKCIGWHCPYCGAPTSYQGHDCPERRGSDLYREFRADGWPLCPNCGEDELWSSAVTPTIETIAGCYRCNWKPPDRRP